MATVPMLAPDGTSGDVPQANVQAAIAKGFKQAVAMTSPDGKLGYVPLNRVADAQKAGFDIDTSHVAPQLAAHSNGPAMQSSLLAPSTYSKAISDTVSGLAKPLAHPIDQIASYGGFKNPAEQGGPIQSIVNNPDKGAGVADALAQVGTGLALGKAFEAAPEIATAARNSAPVKYVAGKISPEVVAGQNYTPSHAEAFEGAIAPATAMGKNFIPQNVSAEALSPIRDTAARMTQGTPVEQGVVKAATASGTKPLDRIGAYQNIVQRSLSDLEAQHAPALAQYADMPVDTSSIVNRLQSLKSPTMKPADISAIDELIAQTKGATNLGDLNRFRSELNTSTSPEYRQSQVQAGRSGLSAQAESDLTGWVRDAYYDNLQQATGQDFAPLKRQEANLITTQEALQNLTSPLSKAQATFNAPTTLREKAGNFANVVKDPKTTVTQTFLRESPAAKTSFLLKRSLNNLPEPVPSNSSTAPQPVQDLPQQPMLGKGQSPTIQGTPVDPFPPSGPPRLGNPQGTLPGPVTLRGLPSRYTPPRLPASTDGFVPSPASPPPSFNSDTARMRVQPTQFNQPEPAPSRGPIAVTPSGEAALPAKGLPAPTPATISPPLTGKALWAQRGAAKMETHGVSSSDIDALGQTAKGKQLLVIASDLTPGSAAMRNLVKQIPAALGK